MEISSSITPTIEYVVARLVALADWHAMQAKHPIDVSGSGRSRASRQRFHETAADDIRALVAAHNAGGTK